MTMRDFRYAIRQLIKSPGFSATVVLTLALGIGASSAIFCLIDGLWLHPLSVPHANRLVRVFATTQQDSQGLFTYSDYQAIAQRASALSGAAAIGRRGSLMPRTDGTSALLLTNVVSSNFFDVLGVKPALGHAFTARDAERLRTHPGVLLGYGFWRREFKSDPGVVGRDITLLRGRDHRTQVEVWGVLPADFRELEANSDRDLWMPAETWAAVANPGELTSNEFRWFNVIGRLAPGATAAQANDQVSAIAHALETADPASHHGRGALAVSDFKYRMDLAGTTGLVLFAIVGCVVLLATVNVAHLLLARALARSPEVALRLSLGARRVAIARQLLMENALLGFVALAAGLAFAAGIAVLLPHLLVLEPAMLNAFPAGSGFHLDWRVFLFASLLALGTILLLAAVPLLQAARAELLPVLQSSSNTRTEGRTPALRRVAIWVQIAISFALLVSTAALVRSFLNTRTQSIGVTRNQVLVAFAQDPDEPMRSDVLANLRALPGVQAAAFGIRAPLMPSEGGIAAKVLLPSHPELRDPVEIKYNAVSPDFLAVTGTRVLLGRGLTAADNTTGPPVVLVSQAMARRYWPATNPIGQIVRMPKFNNGSDLELRVVGITEDAPINQLGEIPEPYMYIPFRFSNMGEVTFVVQSSQNAMSLAQDARQVFIHANPLLDPMFITSLPELIRYSSGNYQMMAELVSILGVIGLALTIVGLYGFLAFRVTQRRREIGIRMALGATRQATSWLILRDTARMAVIGLLLGLGASMAAARLEASMLFGVRPLDTLSLVAAFCVVMAAVAAAAWLPARRAASIEPMQALRTE
jgi:predicted permease